MPRAIDRGRSAVKDLITMRCYIVNSECVEDFVAAVRWDSENDLEDLDDQVRPITRAIVSRPELNDLLNMYTQMLHERGIEMEWCNSATRRLDAATLNACAWWACPGDMAPGVAQQLEQRDISMEEVKVFLPLPRDEPMRESYLEAFQQLHSACAFALRQIGPSQIGFFRADL
jgi:hypothetical protein